MNSNFSKNRAVSSGGAVSVNTVNKEMSKVTAHHCSLIHNTAYMGGAMDFTDSKFSISDSNYSNNIATEGGVVAAVGAIVMTNCHLINNTASYHGGVVKVLNGSLQMSNCLISNNTSNISGGVGWSSGSTIGIANCIFKMNLALGGGVFYTVETTILVRNSLFAKNFAEKCSGVFAVRHHSVINITQSHIFENQAKNAGGVLESTSNTKVHISDTEISQNSGNTIGAIVISGPNSILELSGSQFENNNAQDEIGALLLLNNSLLVAFNSSFKGNKAYRDSSIRIMDSTAYLEKCTFMENFQTSYGGTITITATILKMANTFFINNAGYDIYDYQIRVHGINRLDTYRCLFKHDNFSLKSNTNLFEKVAERKNIIFSYQLYRAIQETPYATSKMFIYL